LETRVADHNAARGLSLVFGIKLLGNSLAVSVETLRRHGPNMSIPQLEMWEWRRSRIYRGAHDLLREQFGVDWTRTAGKQAR
jgi:hypothetical protein